VTSGGLGPLAGSDVALCARFDVALLDLDGVVYIGASAVPRAAEILADVRARGMRLAFVTNNAARPPHAVAEHLTALGIHAVADEVITSSQAAARYLAELLPAGAPVLVVGTVGLDEALRERGLRPVRTADDEPLAVVQGYSPTLDWALLAEGCIAILRGVPWVATNLDPTVPSPRGPLPGNGSLVAALRHATGATPTVTGKPDPHMHLETVRRTNALAPIVVGDRLDTDIEGANAANCPSLLVLTGVTTARDLLRAAPAHRPTYLAPDLGGLLVPHSDVQPDAGTYRCGNWTAWVEQAVLMLSTAKGLRDDHGSAADGLDSLRALSVAAWAATDDARECREINSADDVADREIRRLGLT
jgi:HAD superfamily hydrolase (TIGR01450 family)